MFAGNALSVNEGRSCNIIINRKLFLRAFEWYKGDVCTTSGYRVIGVNVLANTASLGSVTVRETSTGTDVYYYSVTMERCDATQAATSGLASVNIRTLEHRNLWIKPTNGLSRASIIIISRNTASLLVII